MADNVLITPGSGNTVAADEVTDGTLGTVKVQYVKLMDGTLDGTTKAAVGANGLKVDGSGATQPVSGTVTTTPPANASTNLTQVGGAAIAEGQTTMANSVPVVIASNQTAVPVSGTVTTTPPSNASTNITQISGTAITEGQKAMTASLPVVIASDQSAVPVTGTFFQGTQPVSGTVTANQGTATADTTAWPVKSGVVTAVTAAWVAATSTGTTLSIVTTDYSTVAVTFNITGTVTGGSTIHEVSDDGGTTWYPITLFGIANSSSYTNYPFGSGTIAFQGNVSGYTNFRIRLGVGVVGSGTVNLRLQAFALPGITSNIPMQAVGDNLRVRLQGSTGSLITEVTTLNALKVDTSTAAPNLAITATAATGVGVTATLPASAANFHYITLIEIHKYFTAANAASATPLVVTTTNLPGSVAFTFGQPLGTIGTTDERIYNGGPVILKSSVVNTATTVVCPATTGVIWRVNVFYYAAP